MRRFPLARSLIQSLSRSFARSLVVAVVVLPTPALADLKLDGGPWRQGPLREEYKVQQWLDACGPAPQSTTSGGGENVEIRAEGDELAFVGGGRVFRTNQCYDPMPTLSRETHTRDPNGKIWRTRCATGANDPRKATLNTLVVATTDTQIEVSETGRYEITLEDGRCIADVTRSRSYSLAADKAAAPTPSAAPRPAVKEPEAPKPSVCSTPGDPQKLEVRPSKKLLRTEEAFQFRARVLDAKGCATPTTTSWKLAPESAGKGVTVDGTGRVSIAKDATEGTVEIIATAGGKDARVTVEVTSPARYDELLASSGLNASGENDEASSVAIATQSIGAGEGRVEDRSQVRRLLFLALIGTALVGLGVAAVLLSRRARRAKALLDEADERHEARVKDALDRRRKREAEHAAQQRAHEESVAEAKAAAKAAEQQTTAKAAVVCPTCGREEASGTSFCPNDGSPLAPATGRACPVCSRDFGPNVSVCPQHKVELLAHATAAAPASRRGKICPTCGERFQGQAEFCGKDGTALVLIN